MQDNVSIDRYSQSWHSLGHKKSWYETDPRVRCIEKVRPVRLAPPGSSNLTRHSRGRTTEPIGDRPERLAGLDAEGDLLAIGNRESCIGPHGCPNRHSTRLGEEALD